MRFVHIADVHLGATPDWGMPWGELRHKEIWDSFDRVIDVCNKEKADLLLIAGDLFHRQPKLSELKELNYRLGKLNSARAVIMAGNHDYIGARSYYQNFEWNDRVHIFLKDTIEAVEFPDINTVVYGLSYLSRDITEPLYDNVKPEHKDRINILLAHGGDEKNIPINRKKLLESGFDYIALGHIHKPEIISERMAYSGSLEPLDKNEIGSRGYIIGDIEISNNAYEGLKASAADQAVAAGVKSAVSGRQITTDISIRFVPASGREYKRIELEVNAGDTNGSLLDKAKEAIKSNGERHIYSFYIKGFRDADIKFDTEAIKKLGNICEVTDESLPDYDFDALFRENSDNLIGLFIEKIRQKADQDELAKKALYYGIEALLGARDMNK
ncbi:MAG: DNA repair exonuclease [Clostridiales bacterium]|nr:DNA repair exonuclease [Clostridiales bacterium]